MAAVQNQGTGGVYFGMKNIEIARYRLSTLAPFPNPFLKLNNGSKKIIDST
ncbi:MAG: hypothetical protein ACOX8E_06755 [Ruminococcus sp.]|jgi:hypothetical protein